MTSLDVIDWIPWSFKGHFSEHHARGSADVLDLALYSELGMCCTAKQAFHPRPNRRGLGYNCISAAKQDQQDLNGALLAL